MNALRFGLLVLATFPFTGCGKPPSAAIILQEQLLPHLNPTNYEFQVTIIDVKAAIQKGYENWQSEMTKKYRNRVWQGDGNAVSKRVHSRALQLVGLELLLWKGDGDALTKGLLAKPGNEDDAYLSGQEAPFSESRVYFKDGQPLIYYADFHIHRLY